MSSGHCTISQAIQKETITRINTMNKYWQLCYQFRKDKDFIRQSLSLARQWTLLMKDHHRFNTVLMVVSIPQLKLVWGSPHVRWVGTVSVMSFPTPGCTAVLSNASRYRIYNDFPAPGCTTVLPNVRRYHICNGFPAPGCTKYCTIKCE